MISIARHIELLLLDHDCVIVPGLGAFIANHASANYNEDGDKTFLPPYRNICYNPNLVTNDGLLVQAYMNVYDAAYPEAVKQMNADVADLNDELDIRGTYELKGIGTLHKGVNGIITFVQQNAGVLTPSLYGLYSFCAKSWEEVLEERKLRETLEQTLVIPINTVGAAEGHRQDDTAAKACSKQKKTKFIDFAVAAAASILLFFLFSYPAHKSSSTPDNTYVASSLNVSKPAAKATATEAVAKPKHVVTATPVVAAEADKSSSPAGTTLPVAESEETEKKFVIVLATCVVEKNANELIEKLKKDGYSDVVFDNSGKMNRVTYSSFATFNEAREELSELRHLSPHFKDAWVYNTKK